MATFIFEELPMEISMTWRQRASVLATLAVSCAGQAFAATSDEAKGLWLSADKDAVIEFKACADRADALCGRIVWDKDAGTPADTCGVQIAQLNHYENDAWRDGWVYDPRDKKNYKGVIRVKGGVLKVRAFIGVEVLGETEEMTRTAAIPSTPVCKK
jgi:uncharacterized protein (DUF2147 family)